MLYLCSSVKLVYTSVYKDSRSLCTYATYAYSLWCMSTDSIILASSDDPNTLLTFILTDKEDRVVEVPVLKASRAGDADIGPVTTPFNPNAVKPRQYAMMRLLAN
jgi:hypothetical protein